MTVSKRFVKTGPRCRIQTKDTVGRCTRRAVYVVWWEGDGRRMAVPPDGVVPDFCRFHARETSRDVQI